MGWQPKKGAWSPVRWLVAREKRFESATPDGHSHVISSNPRFSFFRSWTSAAPEICTVGYSFSRSGLLGAGSFSWLLTAISEAGSWRGSERGLKRSQWQNYSTRTRFFFSHVVNQNVRSVLQLCCIVITIFLVLIPNIAFRFSFLMSLCHVFKFSSSHLDLAWY